VELVARQGEQVDGAGAQVDGYFAHRLHGVHMEGGSGFLGDGPHLFHRENHPGFVVGVHGGDQGGAAGNRGFHFHQVELAAPIHRQVGDGVAFLFQKLADAEDGRVLHCGGYDVALLGLSRQSRLNGGVVAFAAAAVEDDFGIFSPQQSGDLFSGGLHSGTHLATKAMHRRRIAVQVTQVGQHRRQRIGVNLGGSVVV
jgi:hypothetical protein